MKKLMNSLLDRILFWSLPFALFLLLMNSCSEYRNENTTATHQYGFDDRYESLIDSIITILTLEEKIYMLHGCGMFVSGGVERLGIPELRYTDGPTGVREEMERSTWNPLNLTTDSVTFFPTGTALAATWNEELAFRYGQAIGRETNARGKDILLGPAVNIIRTPLCGRNFEYFTEDPWLNSRIAIGYINGVQSQNVAACIKHYALNNQEYERGRVDVIVDERTLQHAKPEYTPSWEHITRQAETGCVKTTTC
jgi:beta-glucosidase